MFDIISKDALRKQIECASNNRVTVIYDDKGYPSFMSVIPRMTIGDCFPEGVGDSQLDAYRSETHPAFKIYDSSGNLEGEVSEIFIGQYTNSLVYDTTGDWDTYRAVSIPGQDPPFDVNYYDSTGEVEYPIRTFIENKGPNWHLMNIWEYALLQYWSYNNNIMVYGTNIAGYDENGKTGVKSKTLLLLTSLVSGWIIGEKISGLTSGATGTLVDVSTDPLTNYTILYIEDNYNTDFINNEIVLGNTSSSTGATKSLYGVGSILRGGTGPLNWSHNHTFSGVFDLANNNRMFEAIDGCRLRAKELSGEDCYMFMMTPGNYRHWTDSLLQSYPAKVSDKNTGFDSEMQLGYQTIDGNGDPVGPIVDSNIMGDVGGLVGTSFEPSALYISSASATVRKMMTLIGLDMVEFPDSEKVDRNETTIFRKGTTTDSLLLKSYPYNGAYSSMWGTYFQSLDYNGRYSNGISFRASYIPNIS